MLLFNMKIKLLLNLAFYIFLILGFITITNAEVCNSEEIESLTKRVDDLENSLEERMKNCEAPQSDSSESFNELIFTTTRSSICLNELIGMAKNIFIKISYYEDQGGRCAEESATLKERLTKIVQRVDANSDPGKIFDSY